MKEIKNYDYPLDEALKICKEYNMSEPLAYLFDKAGFYSDALELYVEVFSIYDLIFVIFSKDIEKFISKSHQKIGKREFFR